MFIQGVAINAYVSKFFIADNRFRTATKSFNKVMLPAMQATLYLTDEDAVVNEIQ